MKHLVFNFAFLVVGLFSFSQNITVSGIVTDSDTGEPLPGVNILVKNTTKGVSSDFDGNYIITDVPQNAILVFSYLGFTSKEVAVSGTTLNVSMVPDTEALSEVVVIGYGTQRKELVSGAYESLSSETIVRDNPARIEEALQGSAAGVQVNANSGSPGSSYNIRIRGITTNSNNSPLVLVDGVRIDDLSIVDPNDIERMDIIKDASSAIYGVQGANGVILITTKKGKKERRTQFSYNSYYSVQDAAHTIKLMDATEYAVYVNETEIADGNPLPYPNLQDLPHTTDWQDELFVTAPLISHSLSATGGSETIDYNLSGAFFTQDGIIASDKSNYERWTVKNNLGVDLTDKLKLNTLLLFTNTKRKTIPESGRGSALYYALNASPLTPIYDGTDGSGPSRGFSYIGTEQGTEIINPFALIHNTYNEGRAKNFTGKIELSYDLVKDLKATSRFNFNYADYYNRSYSPLQYYGPNKVVNNVTLDGSGQINVDRNEDGDRDVYSIVNENTQNNFNYTWESFLDYSKAFGAHNFKVLLGTAIRSEKWKGLYGAGYLVSGPDTWENAYLFNTQSFIIDEDDTPSGSPQDIQENINASSYVTEDRWYSLFGRIQYDYSGKYLLSAMIRRDASTRFGPNNRVGYFPSVSAGWVLSEESFFNSSSINSLKLRGSWGITGNDKIGSYRWTAPLQGANAEAAYPFGNALSYGNALGALSNPDLQWETNYQTNIGFDGSFFNNMLDVSLDYYVKKTEKLLLVPEVSGVLGASAGGSSAPVVNAGDIENKGIDLSLNFNYDFSEDVRIGLGYNLTSIDNKALKVNNAAGFIPGGLFGLNQTTSRFQSGLPIGVFYGLKTNGIFQNQAEIDAHATQAGAQPGDIRYVDIDGDDEIEFGSDEDLTVIGNPIPDVTMGLSFNINFYQFDFATSMFASIGNDVARSYERFLTYSNKSTLYLDRWTGEGTSNSVPRASTNASNNFLFSDFYVEDGSYLRIQNIQLGYSLPASVLEKVKMDKFRIYVAVNNAFTFTKYKGYNPDVSNANPLSAGVDLGQYPQTRTFTTGINVSF